MRKKNKIIMGLTQSAIILSTDVDDGRDSYKSQPMKELTRNDIDVFLNDDILILLESWSMTKDFCSLLATRHRLWRKSILIRKESVRVSDVVNLSYWHAFPMIKEVVLFCGDEPFISTNKKHPINAPMRIPSLVLVTANDNALVFLVRAFHLRKVSLRIEFILDDQSVEDFHYLNGTRDDYTIMKDYILTVVQENKPKELEVIILDRRGDKRERIIHDKIVYFDDNKPFIPIKPMRSKK